MRSRIARLELRPESPAIPELVELLVQGADAHLRDRLLLETCLQCCGAEAGGIWRLEPGASWSPRVERGAAHALPAPRVTAALLSGTDDPGAAGARILRARAGGNGIAVVLPSGRAEPGEEIVEALLLAVLLIEAASGDRATGPAAPLPARTGTQRQIEHDVRNALTSMRAAHQVLEMLGRDLPGEEAARFQEAIARECERAGALLAQGLLPGLGAGRAPTREPAARAVEDVLALEREPWRAAGLDLRLGIDGAARQGVHDLDPADWSRLVRNLVRNAWEALQRGPRSQGAGAAVRFARRDGEFVLRVEDEADGPPDVPLQRLFRSGFSEGKPGGTGEGLAVVRALVRAAGGSLLVARGRPGTLFEVRLPARDLAPGYSRAGS